MSKRLARILAAACAASLVFAAGCSSSSAEKARQPVRPQAVDLTTPERAVRSYLEWTAFAYRMANSQVATQAMTPLWGVHVDSYIQKMRQEEEKGIDQTLTRIEVRSRSEEGTRAIVAAREDWAYEYFSLRDQTYISRKYTISYDTTYTLVREAAGWLVDDVRANPLGTVK